MPNYTKKVDSAIANHQGSGRRAGRWRGGEDAGFEIGSLIAGLLTPGL